MYKVLALTVLAAAQIAFTSVSIGKRCTVDSWCCCRISLEYTIKRNRVQATLSIQELHDMSIKAIMDKPMLTHLKLPAHVVQVKFQGIEPTGRAKFQALQDLSGDFPELIILEQFLTGFLKGSSFAGNGQCNAALQGMIYYGFDVVKYREIYNPKKIMKAGIALQKFQEQQALFSA